MADINLTITVVFGILSTIMVFLGILISRSTKRISEAQKRIGMIALMQPLTKNPEAYRMFLEYMSEQWFNEKERKKIEEAMRRMSIKVGIVEGGGLSYESENLPNEVHKALSGEEMALQKILNVMEEINKKLLPKEEGGEKMPVVHVNVWEGFGQENTKTVIQNIKNVFVALGISADAVEVRVDEIQES